MVVAMRDGSIALTGATALVGEDLEVQDDVTVVVTDGRIAAIGPAAGEAAPEDAEAVDASGLLVIPGFIDAHVHIGFADPADVLAGGVTTARDLGWPRDEIRRLIQRSRATDYVGPRLLWVGQMLTAPGGYPTQAAWAPDGTGLEVATPDAARAAVEELSKAGVDGIKVALNPEVGPTIDHWTLRALVDAAHALRLRVSAHIYGLDELKKALDAGVDELAHMLMSPERIPRSVIDRMVAAGTTIVPTLSVFFGTARDIAIDNLSRFLDAGGNVVYGTDLGNEGPQPGIDEREVAGMADAGLSTVDIVATATTEAADWLALEDRGCLAEGRVADIVAVPESALGDASLLTDVRLVFKEGRRAPARA